MRSSWKLLPLNLVLEKRLKKKFKKNLIFPISKVEFITKSFINREFLIKNGKKEIQFLVKNNMVGQRLGEYIFTKKKVKEFI